VPCSNEAVSRTADKVGKGRKPDWAGLWDCYRRGCKMAPHEHRGGPAIVMSHNGWYLVYCEFMVLMVCLLFVGAFSQWLGTCWPWGRWSQEQISAAYGSQQGVHQFRWNTLLLDTFYLTCISFLWLVFAIAMSVLLSVLYCAQTTESIVMRPSRDCSPAILVFQCQIWSR